MIYAIKMSKLAETLAQEVENDTRMIAKIGEIVALYGEAGKATARRRMIAHMMMTAIKHEDKKRLKVLVEDWREATRKVARYRF